MRVRLVAAAAVVVAVATGCVPQGAADPSGEPSPDAPLVAFYGDSYTLGTGATDPANRWSTIVCELRGWGEFNPSVNGLGFVNNRRIAPDLLQLIVDQHPDIVIVTMGLNDNFSYETAGTGIRDQIQADFGFLTGELPDARVIVVEPFWYTDARPESVEVIIGWARDAAADIDADWIAGASRWIEGHPEWMAADRVHPNDAGYAELARRMDAELTALGL